METLPHKHDLNRYMAYKRTTCTGTVLLKGHCPDYARTPVPPPATRRNTILWLSAAVSGFIRRMKPPTSSNHSENADRVDPGRLPGAMRSFPGHVHIPGSALLKQNTDLA